MSGSYYDVRELRDIKEIRRKYCQLGIELENGGTSWNADALHSHSKLGIYLEEYFGIEAWRQSLE